MENKEIIIHAKKLTEIFREEGIAWRTGMQQKHRYATILIPVGKPKKDEELWIEVQKYRKRYLNKEVTDLLRASKIFL